MNDWLCDTSTWDGARVLLDARARIRDLRGYGRWRGRTGEFTVREAAADMLALADALGRVRFAVVGDSMSALVALQLAQPHADRAERIVALTPPPGGFGTDEAMTEAPRALAPPDDRSPLR